MKLLKNKEISVYWLLILHLILSKKVSGGTPRKAQIEHTGHVLYGYTVNLVKLAFTKEFEESEKHIHYHCMKHESDQFLSQFTYKKGMTKSELQRHFIFQEKQKDIDINFIMHGWMDDFETKYEIENEKWTSFAVKEWSKHGKGTTCFIDWGVLASYEYYITKKYKKELIAQAIYYFFLRLYEIHGVEFAKRVSVAAHSLSSHILAMVFEALLNVNNSQIKFFYGIDAAGVGFREGDAAKNNIYFKSEEPESEEPPLKKRKSRKPKPQVQNTGASEPESRENMIEEEEANMKNEYYSFCKETSAYSVFIHTTDLMGIERELGDANFYILWGKNQPSCNIRNFFNVPLCNHLMALNYFIASLDPANHFNGIQCPIETVVTKNTKQCAPDGTHTNGGVLMGIHNEKHDSGVFVINNIREKFPHCAQNM